MLIPKIAQNLKEEIDKLNILLSQKNNILNAIKKGKDFFQRMESGLEDSRLAPQAAGRMIEYLTELDGIDKQILDINIMVIAKLESFLGDFVAKVNLPERINDAGDVIHKTSVYAVPFRLDDVEYAEVTPDDIWFLKLVKQALGTNNIEILKK